MTSPEGRWSCIACGELIISDRGQSYEIQDAMRAYCLDCAKEVLGIAVPKVGTLQHDTGGGRRVIRETKTH